MRIALFFVFLGLLACEDDSTNCCVDRDSFAVVEATILDAASSPIPSAVVSGIGHAVPCNPPQDPGQVAGESATNNAGWVRLNLAAGLGAPGTYCVSLVVTRAGGTIADTVGVYEMEFFVGTPPDTTRLTVATRF